MKKRLAALISHDQLHLTLGSIFIFSLFLTISLKTPLAGDDWGYAINGTQNNPIWMAYQFYFSWSGRFFSELYGFLVTPHKEVWNILNPLLFMGIFITIARIVGSKRQTLTLLIIIFLMLSVKDDVRMETYTWLMGTTYVIPLFLSLWVFLQLKFLILEQKTWSTLNLSLVSLSVIVIGLMMENIAVVTSFTLMLSVLAFRFYKGRFSKSIWLLTALSIVSLVLLRLSPGAQYRLVRDSAEWISMGLFNQLSHNYPNFIQLTFIDHRFLILTLSALLAWKIVTHKTLFYLFKAPLILIYSLAILSSIALTLNSKFPLLNLNFMLNPSSIYNSIFWVFYAIAVYITMFITNQGTQRVLLVAFLTLAGISNGVMMLSPIFGYRSSLYTIYFLIVVIALLFQSINQTLLFKMAGFVIMFVLVGKMTQTYLYKYTLVERVQAYRLAQIAYYQDHPTEDAWLIRFPIYTVHGGDIEPDDVYHMDVFKSYYHLNPNQTLFFYFPDESYEDHLIKNGY